MEQRISNFLVGTDIEVFFKDKATGEVVSAEGIVQGTKYEPFMFDKGFGTSLDNVTAEFIVPPAKTPYEFYTNVNKAMDYLRNSVADRGLDVFAFPSARLDKEKYLKTENAQIYGCEPAINCWSGSQVYPKPDGSNNRAAGLHIHVGYDNPSHTTSIELSQAMDLFLGVPSILLEPENERRLSGYGSAGAMRFKPYGCEYRTLSSYFADSKELLEWCFQNTEQAIGFINTADEDRMNEIQGLSERIQRTINQNDHDSARDLVERFNIKMLV